MLLAGCPASKAQLQATSPATSPAPMPGPSADDARSVNPEPRPSKADPSEAQAVERGYMVVDAGLIEVRPETADKKLIASGDFAWCAVDRGNQVIWATRALGGSESASELVVVDLAGTSQVIATFPIAAPESVSIILERGELGHIELVSPGAWPQVNTASATIQPVLGCEDDSAWYCYEDIGEPGVSYDNWTLSEHISGELAGIKQARVVAPELLKKLSRPGLSPTIVDLDAQGMRLYPAPEDEDFEVGTAWALTSRYWLVFVGSAHGDYYHPYYLIYDSDTKKYFHPAQPKVRSDKPVFEEAWETFGFHVSPSGRYFMQYGLLGEFEGKVDTEVGQACGWLDGGVLVLP